MSDAIWDEIMKSPLDPDPDEQRNLLAALAPVALAIAVGLAIGIFVGKGEASPATTLAIDLTTTTTTEPSPPDPVVPPGYADTAGVGLRALAVFNRDDNLYVVVNSATRSDMDRTATGEFHIAEWTLAGDGIERTASRAIKSDFAPGVQLVEFPGVAALPGSVPELRVRQATDMVVRSGCNGCAATSVDMADGELPIEGLDLPYSLTDPIYIPVGTGITVAIDELEFGDEWGYAAWHVLDENDARLRVSLIIVFEGTDDPATEDVNPTLLVPAALHGLNQQNPIGRNPDPFTRAGSVNLDRVGEIITADNQPEQILLRWSIEWQHPVGEPISLPLDDVTDFGSVG